MICAPEASYNTPESEVIEKLETGCPDWSKTLMPVKSAVELKALLDDPARGPAEANSPNSKSNGVPTVNSSGKVLKSR